MPRRDAKKEGGLRSSWPWAHAVSGDERVRRMSLIGKDGGKSVRTAHLPTVGSHASRALPRCTRSCSRTARCGMSPRTPNSVLEQPIVCLHHQRRAG